MEIRIIKNHQNDWNNLQGETLPLHSQFSFFILKKKKKNICFKLIQEFPLAVILLVERQSHAPNIPTLIKSLVSFLEESQVFKSKQMASYLLHTLCHRYSTTPHHQTLNNSPLSTLSYPPPQKTNQNKAGLCILGCLHDLNFT